LVGCLMQPQLQRHHRQPRRRHRHPARERCQPTTFPYQQNVNAAHHQNSIEGYLACREDLLVGCLMQPQLQRHHRQPRRRHRHPARERCQPTTFPYQQNVNAIYHQNSIEGYLACREDLLVGLLMQEQLQRHHRQPRRRHRHPRPKTPPAQYLSLSTKPECRISPEFN